jgi:hypothetical protein
MLIVMFYFPLTVVLHDEISIWARPIFGKPGMTSRTANQ